MFEFCITLRVHCTRLQKVIKLQKIFGYAIQAPIDILFCLASLSGYAIQAPIDSLLLLIFLASHSGYATPGSSTRSSLCQPSASSYTFILLIYLLVIEAPSIFNIGFFLGFSSFLEKPFSFLWQNSIAFFCNFSFENVGVLTT